MRDFLPFVVVGLASGAVYGLGGVGLVLTYRTSGVFNFAHGAIASAAAYAFFELHEQHGLPWPLAVALVVGLFGPLMGVGLELAGRRLAEVGAALRVVATVGLLLAIQGMATIIYGPETRGLPQFLPTSTFRVLDVNVGWDQVILVAFGIAVTIALSAILRRTRMGLAMRAVVDAPALLEITGLEAPKVRRSAWMIGSALAAASGILLAPLIGLDPLLLTLLVVQAFGAAALGRFRSLGLTFAGGLAIGALAAVSQRYVTDYPSLLGFPSSLPFIVLFVVLLASRPGTLFDIAEVKRRAPTPLSPMPAKWRNGVLAAAAVVVAFIPSLVGVRLQVYISGAAYVVVFLSLGLLVKTSGQVSLCHAAFVATGAATFSHLRVDAGLPWFVALLGAGMLAVPVGAFVALPAIRLSGVYLALATFGFGVLLERMVYRSFLLFGSEGTRLAPRPDLGFVDGNSDRVYFFLVVAFALAAALAVRRVQRARLGRLLEAVADSPKALTSLGASVTTALVLVFCLSAFLAGTAGALLASGSRTAGPSGLGAFQSLLWLGVIAIAGTRVLSSSLLAAVLLAVVPIYLPAGWADYQPVAFGLAALAVALVAGRVDWVGRMNSALAGSDRNTRTPVAARRADPAYGLAMTRRALTRDGALDLAEVAR
jgi:branched-subunit amino acid ABC-type transport system permease component